MLLNCCYCPYIRTILKYVHHFANIAKEIEKDAFNDFNILHLENEGRVYQLVAKGNQEEVLNQIEAMHPILVDVLQVNFEELFIYELEGRSKSNDQ